MKLQWTDLPPEVQSKLETHLLATLEVGTRADFASLSRSCGKLGCNYHNQQRMTDAFVSSLKRRFGVEQHFNPDFFVLSVQNIEKLGVKCVDIPSHH
jgi:hypothetical protein